MSEKRQTKRPTGVGGPSQSEQLANERVQPDYNTEQARAQAAIRAALDGNSVTITGDLGEWAATVSELQSEAARGGVEAARATWAAMVKERRGLDVLVSGDLPQNIFDSWHPVNLDDVTRPEPRAAVVNNLLYKETLAIPFGQPGGLKSFVLADLAVCVAAGVPWLYPEPGNAAAQSLLEYKTTQGPVLWVDFDNGQYTTRERFYALKRARNLAGHHVPLEYVSMPSPWLDLGNPDHAADFALWIARRPEPPAMVIIDNLTYVSGGLSTNDDGMKNVMAGLKHATELTGALIMPIHHERKSNGMQSRAGERMRGSSAIEAGADLALLFERQDESEPVVTIRATKNRILRGFSVVGLKLATQAGADGVLESARFWQSPIEDGNAARVESEIVTILTERGEVNKTGLAKLASMRTGTGQNRAGEILGAMIEGGKVTATIQKAKPGQPIVCSLGE